MYSEEGDIFVIKSCVIGQRKIKEHHRFNRNHGDFEMRREKGEILFKDLRVRALAHQGMPRKTNAAFCKNKCCDIVRRNVEAE